MVGPALSNPPPPYRVVAYSPSVAYFLTPPPLLPFGSTVPFFLPWTLLPFLGLALSNILSVFLAPSAMFHLLPTAVKQR
jgi:hypothetical protein